ncbi:PKD domain-containing protein [Paracnuella aquatica]|uniref:PKD domain-containing protein n=1 Tax=Paracnuella aquatica TaxID=2268757 RepID=UPI000DEFE0F1|nr:PKD domain-containing protein [Paracnuella aquatica]RPD46507.1 hypothetical protein DRJ53_13790 [Paracnuella aquatica]
MKAGLALPYAILFMSIACTIVACTKGDEFSDIRNNLPPVANAGSDVSIQFPVDSAVLDGTASYDPDGTIQKISWRQIGGNDVLVVDAHAAKHKARKFSIGMYQFELTVWDNSLLSARDTVTTTILPAAGSDHSFYAKNLEWIFPWYSSLEVADIDAIVPPARPFKVFIRRGFSPDWVLVPPLSIDANNNIYEYFIETRPDGAGMYNYGSLYIFYYGLNTSDAPTVKIEF